MTPSNDDIDATWESVARDFADYVERMPPYPKHEQLTAAREYFEERMKGACYALFNRTRTT